MMRSDGPRTTFLGKLVILAFVGACGWGAYRLLLMRGWQPPFPAARTVALRIGCGEGKHGWLSAGAAAFAKTDAGRNTTIELLAEGADRLNVWSPARSMDKDAVGTPLLNEKSIALTPMVFVVWSNRLTAFQSKYGDPSLEAFARALAEPRGWEAAGHPEWGLLKFGIEDRNAALVLLAYDEMQKTSGLTPRDALDVATRASLHSLARNATSMSMREFATRGPDAYDTRAAPWSCSTSRRSAGVSYGSSTRSGTYGPTIRTTSSTHLGAHRSSARPRRRSSTSS